MNYWKLVVRGSALLGGAAFVGGAACTSVITAGIASANDSGAQPEAHRLRAVPATVGSESTPVL